MFERFKARRDQARFEAALKELPIAADAIAEKWKYYCATLVFKSDVPLIERVRGFSFPIAEGISRAHPNIARASQSVPAVYMATLLVGILLSRTHPPAEIVRLAEDVEADTKMEGLAKIVKNFASHLPPLGEPVD